jgi:hypothetical protein
LTEKKEERKLDEKLHLRILHPNLLFSFGIDKYNYFANHTPETLSFTLLGAHRHNNLSFLGGTYSGINYNTKEFFASGLLGLKHDKFNSYLEGKLQKVKDKETLYKSFSFTTDAKINNDLQAFGEVEFTGVGVSKPRLDQTLYYGAALEVNANNNTIVKTKLTSEGVLDCSLIHNYNNMVNFSLNTQVIYIL